MKALFLCIALLAACCRLSAQSVFPLYEGYFTFKPTDFAATHATNITYITNIYITNIYVTNIFIITNAGTALIPLSSDTVDAKLGARLFRLVSAPPVFTFANFDASSFATLYWNNPAGLRLTFPTNGVWWFGPVPTNQVRGAVLIERVGNELWLTP